MALQTIFPSNDSDRSIATDMLAPDFEVACDDNGGTRRLCDFRGHPVVLSFQEGRWDPTREDQVELFNRLMHRFFGPVPELIRLTRDGLWYHLDFDDGEAEIPVMAPLAPSGEVARTYGVTGSTAVFVVGSDGLVRWKHICQSGDLKPSAEVLHALAQLAPVFQARRRRGTITPRDCAATMLAATAVFAVRPGRISQVA